MRFKLNIGLLLFGFCSVAEYKPLFAIKHSSDQHGWTTVPVGNFNDVLNVILQHLRKTDQASAVAEIASRFDYVYSLENVKASGIYHGTEVEKILNRTIQQQRSELGRILYDLPETTPALAQIKNHTQYLSLRERIRKSGVYRGEAMEHTLDVSIEKERYQLIAILHVFNQNTNDYIAAANQLQDLANYVNGLERFKISGYYRETYMEHTLDGMIQTQKTKLIVLVNQLMSVVLAKQWIEANDDAFTNGPPVEFSLDKFQKLSPAQKARFLVELEKRTDEGPMSTLKLERLTELYKLKAETNVEVKSAWLVLGLKSHWKKITQDAVKFVTDIDKIKFTRAIYRAMFDWSETKELALDTFKTNRGRMMSHSAKAIAAELGL